jgi:hypothetical protein
MPEPHDRVALPAILARPIGRPLTQNQLREPEREALLPDPLGTGEEEDLRKPPNPNRLGQAPPGFLMACESS